MWLLNTWYGTYVLQTFLHSFIGILVIERALQIWKVRNPVVQLRYRLMTIIMPVAMLPLYQIINTDRGSLIFRQEQAILNMHRWLTIDLWDVLPVRMIFIAILLITSAVFFVQEILPILRDMLARARERMPATGNPPPHLQALTERLSERLDIPAPPVSVVDDDTPFIFASGAQNHAVVVSSGLLRMFSEEQLEIAIAHELAHVSRRSNAVNWMIFLIRVLMFFNPIALIVFRRIVQDDEHICDDITVSLTGKPQMLADILKVFYRSYTELKPSVSGGISAMHEGFMDFGSSLLIKERITRLEEHHGGMGEPFSRIRFAATIGSIAALNYFVV